MRKIKVKAKSARNAGGRSIWKERKRSDLWIKCSCVLSPNKIGNKENVSSYGVLILNNSVENEAEPWHDLGTATT